MPPAAVAGAFAAAALAVAAVAAPRDASAQAFQTLPRCPVAGAVLVTRIDSATATAGDAFIFKTVERVAAGTAYADVPAGTRGYGVIAFADHARGAGQPGRLVVEPRFLELADGAHVQAMADPQLAAAFAQGESRNVNGALGFVPGFGLAVSGYNALHRGREVVLERGTPFRVVVGDDLATGTCFVPPPSAPDLR